MNWRPWLELWSEEWITANNPGGLEPEVVRQRWLGAASTPVIVSKLDSELLEYGTTSRADKEVAFLAGILARFPTNEAFEALLDRSTIPPVADALAEAIARFPNRAQRLTA
ncbi:hypothetical protein ACWF9G_09080 [Nocardia sp. NPDC055029]